MSKIPKSAGRTNRTQLKRLPISNNGVAATIHIQFKSGIIGGNNVLVFLKIFILVHQHFQGINLAVVAVVQVVQPPHSFLQLKYHSGPQLVVAKAIFDQMQEIKLKSWVLVSMPMPALTTNMSSTCRNKSFSSSSVVISPLSSSQSSSKVVLDSVGLLSTNFYNRSVANKRNKVLRESTERTSECPNPP